jgi:hypothetical protein
MAEERIERRGGKRAGSGRKLIPIDADAIERAASIGCTVEEMAALANVGVVTLLDRVKRDDVLAAAITRGRNMGKATLRRLQWQGAVDGNPTMLIWLGKQMLGQVDRTEQKIEAEIGIFAMSDDDVRARALQLIAKARGEGDG